MLSAVALLGILGSSGHPAILRVNQEGPFETTFIRDDVGVVVNARVGDAEKKLLLSLTQTESYVPGKNGDQIEIFLGNRAIAKVPAGRTSPKLGGAEASLGLDVLKDAAIGLDFANSRITLWPKGGLDEKEAAVWTSALPGWLSSEKAPVKVLNSKRVEDALAISIGDGSSLALFHLGMSGTTIGKGGPAVAGSLVNASQLRLSTGVSISGRAIPWLGFIPGEDAVWERFPQTKGMTVTPDALRSRRVLIDLAASKIYYEELSDDALLSWTLTEWFAAPFLVDGNQIRLENLPGFKWSKQEFLRGSQVIDIAGVQTSEILNLLRSRNSESRNQLAELFSLRAGTFEVEIRTPDGRPFSLKMRREE
jgi:hypothetical protein